MTSGLRVDEILADYFTQKDEVQEKIKNDENSSKKSSSHHKHKHKKKNKKHKKSHNSDDDDRQKHRTHSKERHGKSKTSHKSKHKDKKRDSSKETEHKRETNSHKEEKHEIIRTLNFEPEKNDSRFESVTDKNEKTVLPSAVKLEPDTEVNVNDEIPKSDSTKLETQKELNIEKDNDTIIEEGELVDDDKSSDFKEIQTEGSEENSNPKQKNKSKRKQEERSRSSSPSHKHTRSTEKHHHRHHRRRSRSQSHSRSQSKDKKESKSSHEGHHSSRWKRSKSHDRKSTDKPIEDLRERIDKKRLLEIARKNVLEMIENGTLPQGLPVANLQPQQLVSIKAGGKSVQELTEFCKALAEKHQDDNLSSSGDEHRAPQGSDEEDAPFLHHPFKVKEVQPMIRMNIRNAVQLPVRTTAEKTADAVKLRQQFPVSSGSQHRTKELEWVPVEKSETKSTPTKKGWGPPPKPASPVATPQPVAPEVPPVVVETAVPPQPPESVFPTPQSIDIGSIMAERLHAIRKLQENPHDVQALSKMYNAQQQMQSWAQSKMQPGQFGHEVTNRLLTPEELTGPYPVWTRKDQLTSAAPVQGGIGMHLLKKMGWNPGEGLGKNKEGSLVPLMLDVKTDKKGLYSNTEAPKQVRPIHAKVAHDLSGKHPVSALMELCSKRKWGAPDYQLLDETGPDHRKNFLFKVRVQGVDYQPAVSSASKKQAKALAATVCLQAIGLLPRDLNNPL